MLRAGEKETQDPVVMTIEFATGEICHTVHVYVERHSATCGDISKIVDIGFVTDRLQYRITNEAPEFIDETGPDRIVISYPGNRAQLQSDSDKAQTDKPVSYGLCQIRHFSDDEGVAALLFVFRRKVNKRRLRREVDAASEICLLLCLFALLAAVTATTFTYFRLYFREYFNMVGMVFIFVWVVFCAVVTYKMARINCPSVCEEIGW